MVRLSRKIMGQGVKTMKEGNKVELGKGGMSIVRM